MLRIGQTLFAHRPIEPENSAKCLEHYCIRTCAIVGQGVAKQQVLFYLF